MSRIDSPKPSNGPHLSEAAHKVGEDLRDLGGQVREAAKEKYEHMSEDARNYYEMGRQTARKWEDDLESYVREKPMQALLIAGGVGLLVGLALSRR